MKRQFPIFRVVAVLAGLALLSVICQAQEVFKFDQLIRSNGVVSIRFTDSRSTALASARVLDATTSLDPPINWTNASGALFSSLGGSQNLVTAPAQASFSFYRIVDLGALDTDGDGVPDAVENSLGTNPNVPDWIQDTDGGRLQRRLGNRQRRQSHERHQSHLARPATGGAIRANHLPHHRGGWDSFRSLPVQKQLYRQSLLFPLGDEHGHQRRGFHPSAEWDGRGPGRSGGHSAEPHLRALAAHYNSQMFPKPPLSAPPK